MTISFTTSDAQHDGQRVLQKAGNGDRLAAAEDFLEVDFQADQEQQENKAELGDGVDVVRVGDLCRDRSGRPARRPAGRRRCWGCESG